MSTKSTIEWTEQTWNPATGCTKVSPGCLNCYAEAMARRLKGIGAKGYEKTDLHLHYNLIACESRCYVKNIPFISMGQGINLRL